MKTFKQFLGESNIGYHYGDLGHGRDTVLGRMAGRSTGHFGTGVYFLGKPSQNTGRDDRPVKEIDLSKFHLAKPKGSDGAKQLHDGLKKINWAVHAEDKEEVDRLIRKAAFEIWLALLPSKSDEQLKEIISKEVTEAKKDYEHVAHENNYVDTASTRVMKKLGYDGVDVRDTNFDNTDYGSVIYAAHL